MVTTLHTGVTTRADFDRARRWAWLGQLFNRLLRRDTGLLSLTETDRLLPYYARHDAGLQLVRTSQIVGSAGRARDFDRAFRPLHNGTMQRWLSIDEAFYAGTSLPPVELIKVGAVYFVADGHHRVSVARFWRQEFIEAHVVEVVTPGPVQRAVDSAYREGYSRPTPQPAA